MNIPVMIKFFFLFFFCLTGTIQTKTVRRRNATDVMYTGSLVEAYSVLAQAFKFRLGQLHKEIKTDSG